MGKEVATGAPGRGLEKLPRHFLTLRGVRRTMEKGHERRICSRALRGPSLHPIPNRSRQWRITPRYQDEQVSLSGLGPGFLTDFRLFYRIKPPGMTMNLMLACVRHGSIDRPNGFRSGARRIIRDHNVEMPRCFELRLLRHAIGL